MLWSVEVYSEFHLLAHDLQKLKDVGTEKFLRQSVAELGNDCGRWRQTTHDMTKSDTA